VEALVWEFRFSWSYIIGQYDKLGKGMYILLDDPY
jgi:hypothetical protein